MIRDEFVAMIQVESVLSAAAIALAAWAVSVMFGIGAIVTAVLLVIGVGMLGLSVLSAANSLLEAAHLVVTAESDQDLEKAAEKIAHFVAVVGVASFMAVLTRLARGARKSSKSSGAAIQGGQPPPMKRASGPQGEHSPSRPASQNAPIREPHHRRDLSESWYGPDGKLLFPNEKVAGVLPDGFNKEPFRDVLAPGTIIDRYGNPDGSFFAPAGTPFTQRALPYDSSHPSMKLTRYKVIKPLPVEHGHARPWFDQEGLGTQFKTDSSAYDLLGEYLVEIVE